MIDVHCNKVWICNVVILKETTFKKLCKEIKNIISKSNWNSKNVQVNHGKVEKRKQENKKQGREPTETKNTKWQIHSPIHQ